MSTRLRGIVAKLHPARRNHAVYRIGIEFIRTILKNPVNIPRPTVQPHFLERTQSITGGGTNSVWEKK
jgi:hypothetical protein